MQWAQTLVLIGMAACQMMPVWLGGEGLFQALLWSWWQPSAVSTGYSQCCLLVVSLSADPPINLTSTHFTPQLQQTYRVCLHAQFKPVMVRNWTLPFCQTSQFLWNGENRNTLNTRSRCASFQCVNTAPSPVDLYCHAIGNWRQQIQHFEEETDNRTAFSISASLILQIICTLSLIAAIVHQLNACWHDNH